MLSLVSLEIAFPYQKHEQDKVDRIFRKLLNDKYGVMVFILLQRERRSQVSAARKKRIQNKPP